MTDGLFVARMAVWTYLLAVVVLALGDIASFARLFAVASCFGFEAMVRMPEYQP